MLSLIFLNLEKRIIINLMMTFCCIILAAVCGVTAPIILKKIVDHLAVFSRMDMIFQLFISYSFVLILQRFISEMQFLTYGKWERVVIQKIYNKIFLSLFKNEPQFFINTLPGSITTKIFQAVAGLDILMFDCVFKISPILFEGILIISSLLFLFDFKMAFIVALGAVSYSFCMYFFNEKLMSTQNIIRNENIHAQGVTTDLIQSWKDIKLTNSYDFAHQKLKNATNSILDKTLIFYRTRGIYGFLQAMPICATYIVANYYAIQSYTQGIITIGSILLINGYLLQIMRPLEAFSILFRSVSKNYADFKTIEDIINHTQENITDVCHDSHFENLSIENLSISNILTQINLSIRRGEKIAIIGASGSGKTTLLNIIVGLHAKYTGEVKINEIDIKKIPINEVRQLIAYLNSDARFPEGSIIQNLQLGNEVKIEQGLEFSLMKEKVDLHNCVHFNSSLSAGEIQRLLLARTYLLSRDIEIYDESTSALDLIAEEKIVDSILSQKNKTIIFVTHKMNLLHKFDKVYKLEKGCLTHYVGRNVYDYQC